MLFHPNQSVLSDKVSTTPSVGLIKKEPGFFGCNYEFARKEGGAYTQEFLDQLIKRLTTTDIQNLIIDSRVHMLMPGWYPCIPGWHCDEFNRGPNGQPNLETVSRKMQHILCVIDCGTESLTEFLNESVDLPIPRSGNIYEGLTKMLDGLRPAVQQVKSGDMVHFDGKCLHRGIPAVSSGWRWFIRATVWPSSERKIVNEIRSQTQVYIPDINKGW